jgi:hypothetical protein
MKLGTNYLLRYKGSMEQRHAYVRTDLVPAIQSALRDLGHKSGLESIKSEIGNIQTFGEFLKGGRIIYDLHERLSNALLATDVDNIPLSAIRRPSESIYIHFGPIDQTQGLEGAFVSWVSVPGSITELMNVDFVMRNQFNDPFFWASEDGEILPGVAIDISDLSKGIIDALEDSVNDLKIRNEQLVEQHRQEKARLMERYGQVDINSSHPPSQAKLPLLKVGIALVVNSLLFLSAAPDDVVERWDDRAPEELVLQAEHGEKPGTRKTAERTLSNRDYLKVRLIGHQFAESVGATWHEDSGRTVITHLRRGHFRNQPHGPERSLRKIVFIPPVVVNQGQGEPPGRIYEA